MYPKEAKKLTPLEFASMLKDEADEHGIQIRLPVSCNRFDPNIRPTACAWHGFQ